MHARLAVAVCLVFGSACGGGYDSSPTPPISTAKVYDVYTIAETFSPPTLTIALGDTLRFNFARAPDGLGHNVIFDPTPANHPPSITSEYTSGTAKIGFAARGSFHYTCVLHGGMTGDVVVQ